MKTISATLEGRTIKTNSNVRYLVYARETGNVLSFHFSFATASSTLNRKQSHWFRRVYDNREKIELYVYKLNIEATEWRMLDKDGHDYEFSCYLNRFEPADAKQDIAHKNEQESFKGKTYNTFTDTWENNPAFEV